MLLDIFSSFDDHCFVFIGWFYIVWIIAFLVVINSFISLWTKSRNFFTFVITIISTAGELVHRRSRKSIGGSTPLFISLFLFLISFNLLGLIPYVFSLTRHLSINLAISLPLWLSIILIGRFYDLGSLLAHFQPIGSPAFLNPFLCVIELVRNLVRPITLAVRLTANLRTGHILIGLLGLGFVNNRLIGIIIIIRLGLFYFIFEIGVCFVQAYIFTLLPTLYSDEHPRDSH